MIDDFAFSALPNLVEIWFDGCNLQSITDNMFAGCITLEVLNLIECNIKSIHENSFRDLGSLRTLRIRENRYWTGPVQRNLLVNQHDLETLDLHDSSRLSAIEDFAFRNLDRLTTLDLSDTGLTSLSSAIFDAANLPMALTLSLWQSKIACDDTLCWVYKVLVYTNIMCQ